MEKKTFFAFTGVIFAIAVCIHLLRSILMWDWVIGVSEIPMLVSWVIVLGGGLMTYYAFKFAKGEK